MPPDETARVAFCARWQIPQDHALYPRFEDWALSSTKAVKLDWRRTWNNALMGWLSERKGFERDRAGEDPYANMRKVKAEQKIERERHEARLMRAAEEGGRVAKSQA